jgi:flotillin
MPPVITIVVGLGVVAILLLLYSLGRMFRKAAPNQAIIVYGFRKPRVIKSGAAVIFPVVETYRELTLELMSFDVAPQQDLYTKQGVAVTVEAVAQIKVRSDNESILEVVSFTIREVRDKNEYITNMGRPDIARIKRDAEIAAAEAERDTAIRRANALREAAIAKAASDQDRVIAETASLGKQAEAQRDLAIQKAQYTEQSRRQDAQARGRAHLDHPQRLGDRSQAHRKHRRRREKPHHHRS